VLVWHRPLSLQQPPSQHTPDASLYFPVEANGVKHPAYKQTPLSAQQYLYSIWLIDLARRQQMNVEEDPILDALSLSFIEGLVTGPHPRLFLQIRDFPPPTQLSRPQSQAQCPSLSSLLRSIVILVQECLNYVDQYISPSSRKPSTLAQESLPKTQPNSRHS